MSNITKLPDSFERQWRVYEAQIREAMAEFPQDETEYVVTSLKPVYLRAVKAAPFSDLVHERILTERVDRELKEFALAEKKSQLINVAQLEPEMMQMVGVFRAHLLACDDKLKADLDALYGTDIDIKVLNGYTLSALAHLARYDVSTTNAAT